MAKLNWPPKNTFKYEFREGLELDLELPLISNKNLNKAKLKDSGMSEGRGE